MKILYVEDDPNDVELTINALNKSDGSFSITTVQKYKEALKLLSGPDSKEYDLVLSDKNLPDGSGLELLAAIRSAEIPVAFVLITGQGDENSAGAALKSGSDDYIIKQKDYLKHLSTTLIKAQTEHKNRLNQLNKNIHLLFIQNSKADENLIIKHVRDHAPYIHMTFVESAIEVLKKINSLEFSKSVDVILLDFNLPEMSALEFLTEFKQKSVVDIPVVIVGEPGNEENVVRALKSGASDFLVKTPGYLMRLPTIIENVINISQLKKEKEALFKSEERYRIAFKNGLDAQYIATLEDGLIIETNQQFKDVFGYEIDEVIGKTSRELSLFEDYSIRANIVDLLSKNGYVNNFEVKGRKKSGEIIWCSLSISVIGISENKLIHGVVRDITEVKQAADILQQREKKYRLLFEAVPVGISISNAQGRMLSANPAMQEIMGYKEEELQAIDLFDVYLDRDMRTDLLNIVQQSGHIRDYLVNLKRKDGTSYSVLFNVDLIEYEGKAAYLTVCRDITKQNQIREELHASNQQLSRIMDNLQDAYFQTDASGKFVIVNPRAASMYGYNSVNELIGLPATTLDARTNERHLLQVALEKSDSIYDWTSKGKRKDGTTFWISMNFKLLRDKSGSIIGTESLIRDISERKLREEEINQRNAELMTLNQIGQSLSRLADETEIIELLFSEIGKIFDNRNLYIALFDSEKQLIKYPAYTIDGKKMTIPNRLLANGITDYVIENNKILLINQDFIATLQRYGIELRGKPAKSLISVPMKLNEEVIGVITLQDYEQENVYTEHHVELLITISAIASSALQNARLYGQVQKELENLKITKEALFERDSELLESQKIARLGTYFFDLSNGVFKTSETMDDLFGINKDYDLSIQGWAAIIHPDDREMMLDYLQDELIKHQQEGEKEFRIVRYNDEKTRWLYTINHVVVNDQGELVGIRGTSQDITERKQMEDSLRRNEELFRNSFENAHVGVSLTSSEGKFLRVNNELCNIVGYSSEELTEMKFNDITIEQDKYVGFSEFHRMIAGEIDNATFEKRYVRKNGQIIWVFISEAVIRDPEGNFSHFITYTQDITEQKKYEEKIEQNNLQLRETFKGAIDLLALASEKRDPYTAGHQKRVTKLAVAIAKKMEIDENTIEGINIAGIIHDIGKISVPVELLSKPTKLTDLEFSIIKTHSQSGYQILSKIDFPWPIAEIVYQHHERLNGSGYPRGLKSDDILIESKIIAVADVVEAMSSNRPYRGSMGINAALEEIENKKGIFYDPSVVETCRKLFLEEDFIF